MQIVLLCDFDEDKLPELESLSERYAGNHITPESVEQLGLEYFTATEFFKLVNNGELDPKVFWCINCDLWE